MLHNMILMCPISSNVIFALNKRNDTCCTIAAVLNATQASTSCTPKSGPDTGNKRWTMIIFKIDYESPVPDGYESSGATILRQ